MHLEGHHSDLWWKFNQSGDISVNESLNLKTVNENFLFFSGFPTMKFHLEGMMDKCTSRVPICI